MPLKPPRTQPGQLAYGRSNVREASVMARFTKSLARVSFDFSVDGDADTSNLGERLPAGSIITDITSDITTEITGATAWDLEAGAQTLVSGSTNLTVATNSETLSSSPLKLSADSSIAIDWTGTVTAGVVTFYIEYLSPEFT
jgi:hypothetical protein